MFMVTIIFIDDKKKTREFYIFRESFSEVQESLQMASKRLSAFKYQIIASIVETVEEHFSKDISCMEDDIKFH